MKLLYSIFAISVFMPFWTSCSNEAAEDVVNDTKVDMTFYVSSSKQETRVHVEDFNSGVSNVNINWDETDKLSVFTYGHQLSDPFKYYEIGDFDNIASFKGKSYKDASEFYFLYPYQETAKLTNRGVEFTIPATQKAINNTIDPASAVLIGKYANNSENNLKIPRIALNHVCAYFYITLGPGISKVTISATNENWKLAGPVAMNTANIYSAGNHITSLDNGVSSVSLTDIPADGGTFFIAFIPSGSVKSSLRLDVAGSLSTFELEEGFQFAAGHFYGLGVYNKAPEPPHWSGCGCYGDCDCSPENPCEHEGCTHIVADANAEGSDVPGDGGNGDIDE